MNNNNPARLRVMLNVLRKISKKIAILVCTALVIPLFSSFVYAEGETANSDTGKEFYVQLTEEAPGESPVVDPNVTPVNEQPAVDTAQPADPSQPDSPVSPEEEPVIVDSNSDLYLTDAVLNSALARYGIANKVNEYDPNQAYDQYQFDKDDWRLLLINKTHSIPEDYTVELGTIYGSWTCDKRVIEDLLLMLRDARSAGTGLYIASPYRTSSLQVSLYNNKITKFMNTGMSYLEAYKLAGQAVTIPGTSEHEAGLCFDFLCDSYKSLSEGFEDTKAGQWLAENAYKYGFILRYPKEKEYITTIEYEPWHFRYVGVEAATVMYNEGITLEEFWEIYLD